MVEQARPAHITCDLCGRPAPQAELQWHRGELLCGACWREEASCGCSDDSSE